MTAPAGNAAAAVWISILPDLSGFGRALIDELTEAGRRAGEGAGAAAESGFARNAKRIAAAAAGIGVAVGVALVGAMNIEAANDKLAAQLGLTGKESERYGRIAGDLYSGAYGDSLETVNEALRLVTQNVGASATSSDADLQRITASVLDVATAFDQDLGGTTAAVGQLMRTGLAPDADAALDIITAGLQGGADKAGDFLDTLNEYGGQFQKMGLDGQAATGLITQGLQAGARDADLVADAIKEFSIRAIDGSSLTADSFDALGLSGAEMAAKIAKGGPEASGALDVVLDRLRGVADPVERSRIAVGLFGTQAEDLGAALYALDPSSAVAALGQVEGAAGRMGATLNDNATTNLESFKRQAISAFVTVVGGQVLPILTGLATFLAYVLGPAFTVLGDFLNGSVNPALSAFGGFVAANQTPITIVAGVITAFFLPALIAMGVQSTIAAGRIVIAWVVTQAAAVAAGLVHSAQIVRMVAGWALLGARALLNGGLVVAGWLLTTAAGATALVAALGAFALMIAHWVLLGTQSLLHAARVAAAWLISMGPIGLVVAAVVGLVVAIIANWETIEKVLKAGWEFVRDKIWAPFINFLTVDIPNGFRKAVDDIGKVWSGIKRLLAVPVNFMIDIVYNNGIRKGWNFVAGLLGLKQFDPMPLIPENARGGIIPGYSPGRDDQISRVSGGEAIMRPEWTRAVGPDFIMEANRAARVGGISGARKFMADPRYKQAVFPALQRGRLIEGADHDGPGSRTSGFGGVKAHVAQAGHELGARFGISSIGGVAARSGPSDHPRGLALDFMTYSDIGKGDRLAGHLVPNAGHYAVKYLIWKQQINSGSGWRGMEDRGGVTANHYDHVHVSFLDGPGGGGGGGGSGFSGEGGNFLLDQARRLYDGATAGIPAAVAAAVGNPPPEFRRVPPAIATRIIKDVGDFLFGRTSMDSGGLARGRGFLAKSVVEPERVLSPRQTAAFERLVDRLPFAATLRDTTTATTTEPTAAAGDDRLERLVALLERQGAGATINVEDRSGDPGETARSVVLALRLA